MMLYRTLKANGGLPRDAVVIFANTGKERPETLEFVRRCGEEWSCPIAWVEFRPAEDIKHRYEVVDFESASRNGEPFEMLLEWKGFAPNPVARMCTQHLKINAMHGLLRDGLGWESWESFIGIRFDEPRRWKIEGPDPKATFDERRLPLRHARIMESDVMSFWADQPFDLGLRRWEGNCDLCFLKARGKLTRMIRDYPESAQWWIGMEERFTAFREDRPSYASMLRVVKSQPMLPLYSDDEEDRIPCLCTD